MTILAHGTMSAAITSLITDNPIIIISTFILGILNDILRVILREQTWNGTYLLLHRPDIYFSKFGRNPRDAWYIYALWVIIFPIGLHALIDWKLHKESGGWYWYAYPIELLFWIGFCYTYLHSNWIGVF